MSRVIIADLPINDRPRERIGRLGAEALSDVELLAILIGPGTCRKSSIDLARELLSDGLLTLARQDWAAGKAASGIGPSRGARIAAALELGRRTASAAHAADTLTDTAVLGRNLVARYAHHVQERLGAYYLDSRRRVIREREIYVGTLTSASVSTRDVIRLALEYGAASAIVFHNHPSGDPTPSAEDLHFTRGLLEAGRLMNVEILDHLIVGADRFISLKQRGQM